MNIVSSQYDCIIYEKNRQVCHSLSVLCCQPLKLNLHIFNSKLTILNKKNKKEPQGILIIVCPAHDKPNPEYYWLFSTIVRYTKKLWGMSIESPKNGPRKNGPRKNGHRKMVAGKNSPRKNGTRKNGHRKIVPRKNSPRKNSPRKNGPREKWSPENWSPGNSETKNRGVGVKHRGVCVVCWVVIDIWQPKTRQQTQNSETNPKHENKKSWGDRRASWCLCGMFGCDQSMKTQNSTTNPKFGNKPKTRKQKIVGWASSIVVSVWNVQMWSIYENSELDNKSSWTPLVFYSLVHMYDRDVNVKHLFVCVVESINKNESRLNFLAFFWRRTIFEGHFSGHQFSGDHFSRGPFFQGPFFLGSIFRGPFFWGPFFRVPCQSLYNLFCGPLNENLRIFNTKFATIKKT